MYKLFFGFPFVKAPNVFCITGHLTVQFFRHSVVWPKKAF